MAVEVVPVAEAHFEGLYRALDSVARERRFLAFLQAPPKDEAFAFFRQIVARRLCQVVAVEDGAVLGWCDVLPTHGEARAHVGVLGIGVVGEARGRGIGRRLMELAVDGAWARGMSRIELTVRADNPRAQALYERLGFVVEGVQRGAFCVDGASFDAHAMALVR
ncbi:MAG: GNAT family N-acetyltransferase [Burkholderiaceae bacterium]